MEPTCIGPKLPRSLCAIGLGSCLDRNLRWMPVDPIGSELYLGTRKTRFGNEHFFSMTSTGLLGVCFVLCVFNVFNVVFIVGKHHCEWKWRDWMEFLIFLIFRLEDLTILFCKGLLTARYWEMSCFMTPSQMMRKEPRAPFRKMALVHPWQMLPGNSFYKPSMFVGSTVALDIDFQSHPQKMRQQKPSFCELPFLKLWEYSIISNEFLYTEGPIRMEGKIHNRMAARPTSNQSR